MEFVKTKKKKTGLLLLMLVAFVSVTAAVFNSLGYSGSRWSVVVLLAVAVFLDIDRLYYTVGFCLPISSILKFSAESMSILPVLYLIIIIKVAAKKKIKYNVNHIVGFAIFSVLQFFCVLAYEASLVSVMSLLLNIVFVMVSATYFARYNSHRRQLKNTAIFYITGIVSDIILSEIFSNIPYIIDYQKQSRLDYNNRFAALNLDPNEYAQLVLIAVGLLIAILPLLKTKGGKIVDIVAVVFLCVSGYRSYSKSYAVTLVIMFAILIVIYLVRVFKKKGIISATLMFIPITIVFVGGCVLIYNYVILPVFEAREAFNADLLTGRDYIWREYFKALSQRVDVIFLGCGAGNSTFLHKYCSLNGSTVTHNFYLEFLIEHGIIGMLALAVAWAKPIKSAFKKFGKYMMLPLAAFLITSFSISINSNDCLYFVMVLMCMAYGRKMHLTKKQKTVNSDYGERVEKDKTTVKVAEVYAL